MNHLRPLITYESPSRTAVVAIQTGFEPGIARLGHREAAANLSGDERLEPRLFLLGRAEFMQDFHVAGVRRLTVEDEMAQRRAAQLLAQQGVLHELEPGPAVLLGNLRREEPHLADSISLRRQRGQQFAEGTRQEIPLERIDLVDQELANRFERLLQRLRDREVHEKLPAEGDECADDVCEMTEC